MSLRSQLIGLAELCQRPVPPSVIAGLLPERGFMILQGPPGAGKSFFALELAVALATRTPAWGQFIPTKRPRTLYVAADSAGWDIAAQARKLLAGRDIHPNLLVPGGEHGHAIEEVVEWDDESDSPVVIEHEVPAVAVLEDPGPIFGTDQGAADFAAMVQAEQFGLVILDTLLSMHVADENDNSEMRLVMERLKAVREHALVLAIHHVTKPTQNKAMGWARTRGAGAIAGTVDGVLELSPKGEQVRVWVQKQRSVRLEPFTYYLSGGEDAVSMTVVNENKIDPITVTVLATVARGDVRWRDVVEAVGNCHKDLTKAACEQAVNRRLKQCERDGLLAADRRNIKNRTYRLTEPGVGRLGQMTQTGAQPVG